jgi:ABC-type multidrug transport system ATPase subunit
MPFWFRFRPNISVKLPIGVSVGFDWAEREDAAGDDPAQAARRARHVVALSDEVLDAIAADRLEPAIERLLVLADEFPAHERRPAAQLSARMHVLARTRGQLSEDGWARKREELISDLVDAVAEYRGAAPPTQAASAAQAPLWGLPSAESPSARAAPDGAARAGSPPSALPGDLPALRCEGVGRKIGERWILRDASLIVDRGSVVGVVGRNGAGKTTLLRLLAQQLAPDTGRVSFPSLVARGYSRGRVLSRIAYVPQMPGGYRDALEGHLRWYATLHGIAADALDDEVSYVIERFGLGASRNALWAALPGGFRTRVALARATLASPDVLILDEPLGPLDLVAQRAYLRQLRDLANSRRRVCTIVSSHDVDAIAEVADYVVVLREGDVAFSGIPPRIEEALDGRSFEFSGTMTSAVRERLDRLARATLRRSGSRYVLTTDRSVSAADVLTALMGGGMAVRSFQDISQSPQRFIDGEDAADA